MDFTGSKEIKLEPNKVFFSLNVDTETSYTLSIIAQTGAGVNASAFSLMPVFIQDESEFRFFKS